MFTDPSGESITLYIILAVIGVITASAIEYADAKNLNIVIDTSILIPFSMPVSGVPALSGSRIPFPNGYKLGISTVFSFANENNEYIEFYPHFGVYSGYGSGLSYSVGVIENYINEGDYKRFFISSGGGYIIGIDHSFNQFNPYETTVKSTSITFNIGINVYIGNDFYLYMKPWTIRLG